MRWARRNCAKGPRPCYTAEESWARRFYSASLAGTPVHRILDALDEDARKLYSGRARARVSIRPAVSELEESLRQSREATVRPENWEEVLNALADTEAAHNRCDEALKAQRVRRDRVQRCLDALPAIGQLGEQENKRAELPPLPELDAQFLERSEQVIASRNQVQCELDRLKESVERLEARVAENRSSGGVLVRSAEIQSARQQLAVYRQWRNDRIGLDADLVRLETELRAGMVELGLHGEPDLVESLRAHAADELALREAGRCLDEASDRLQQNRDKTADIERELENMPIRLAQEDTMGSVERCPTFPRVGDGHGSRQSSAPRSGRAAR